jgi:hypothetical protein
VADGGLVPQELERRIYEVRGHNVMLYDDLVSMYGVDVRALNHAVMRNAERFPEDFMISLTPEEVNGLRSQTVISKPVAAVVATCARLHRRDIAMLSSVLVRVVRRHRPFRIAAPCT